MGLGAGRGAGRGPAPTGTGAGFSPAIWTERRPIASSRARALGASAASKAPDTARPSAPIPRYEKNGIAH